ncbi:MAG: hypothetical protein ACRC7O_14765, partial [Fimbriiglobus sp.]
MDIAVADAVFVVNWMASRSVAEVGRRGRAPLPAVLGAAARLRDGGWPLPSRPLEDTAPAARKRKPVLVSTVGLPDGAAWVDGEGDTWTPAGRRGRGAECFRCGRPAGPNGFNRLTRDGEPGRRCACPGCVKVVSLPAEWGGP